MSGLRSSWSSDSPRLAGIKRKLDRNRLTTPLFDTRLFTRHIEAAYAAMHRRYQAGLLPDHIDVTDLHTRSP
jgi:protein O-GlcNAc transferase